MSRFDNMNNLNNLMNKMAKGPFGNLDHHRRVITELIFDDDDADNMVSLFSLTIRIKMKLISTTCSLSRLTSYQTLKKTSGLSSKTTTGWQLNNKTANSTNTAT